MGLHGFAHFAFVDEGFEQIAIFGGRESAAVRCFGGKIFHQGQGLDAGGFVPEITAAGGIKAARQGFGQGAMLGDVIGQRAARDLVEVLQGIGEKLRPK